MPYKAENRLEKRRQWYAKNKERLRKERVLKADQRKEYKKKYIAENHEAIKARTREIYREKHEEKRAYAKSYYHANKDKMRQYAKNQMDNNPNRRISHSLRRRINNAIKNGQRAGSAVSDLGCSINEFKEYISTKFVQGMSWDNYGEWHLDHIVPLASFDLTDREQFLKACHFSNYQPLWALDNLKKGKQLLPDGFDPSFSP